MTTKKKVSIQFYMWVENTKVFKNNVVYLDIIFKNNWRNQTEVKESAGKGIFIFEVVWSIVTLRE